MGEFDGDVAKMYQIQFARAGYGTDELRHMRENLIQIRPEFIPTVYQLINIYENSVSIQDWI